MRRAIALIGLALASAGCIRAYATGAVADALSGSGGVYATDDDPELIEGAVPFGLKTMEAVLVQQPEHRGLLTALASGFVQYGVAFVSMPADLVAVSDLARSQEMKLRARRLFLRARDYGLRGLEVEHEHFQEALRTDAARALLATELEDVPLLYWTAAAWGSAVAADKTDTQMIADLPIVQALADRAMTLDPSWNRGALHELFITLETVRPGGTHEKAREHFQRALELSGATRAGPFVSLAEDVSVQEQNLTEFRQLLERALAIDVQAHPEDRLANVIMQRRARWLLARVADLFLDSGEEEAVDPAPPTP
ncbi:MAG: hypothetical protein IT384_24530 [Deltaproteobacteria bacterium]|nr:hypothetical protein [Deltaproteobacteria bacterium]